MGPPSGGINCCDSWLKGFIKASINKGSVSHLNKIDVHGEQSGIFKIAVWYHHFSIAVFRPSIGIFHKIAFPLLNASFEEDTQDKLDPPQNASQIFKRGKIAGRAKLGFSLGMNKKKC